MPASGGAPAAFEDTIIAASTPPGRGALGIVRLSGPAVLEVLSRHCIRRGGAKGDAEYFRAHPRRSIFCDIVDENGAMIDEGLVVFFAGPASYTGEDGAEISLHGNPLLLRRFIMSVLTGEGLRPADAGEFTRRAFLNGRMDLTQAEAVARVIEARGDYELNAGRKLLTGELSRMVSRFRSGLISLKAETEAEVDFSTEDLTFESREQRRVRVEKLIVDIDSILERADSTARLTDGFQVALAGIPNAGKSSLLNMMLGWERAIVSPIPGTTRDYVSEELQLDGVVLRIVDTAGLRESEDRVEEEGVRRSRKQIAESRIVLHVIDASMPSYEAPELPGGASVIHVHNKIDQLNEEQAGEISMDGNNVRLSCKTGDGMDDLKDALRNIIFSDGAKSDPLLLEDRHRFHFSRTRDSLAKVLELWEHGAPDEVTALEIDNALDHTGRITGTISNEEILGRIFSLFCVGK